MGSKCPMLVWSTSLTQTGIRFGIPRKEPLVIFVAVLNSSEPFLPMKRVMQGNQRDVRPGWGLGTCLTLFS
jgi:hypothetical protein